MANLVSPGVSVTITDESFFIPAAASTVPLIFIATADEKKRADGLTDAAGTFEHNVIRTVTSLKQSTELYGIPRFLEDYAGSPQHGDVRNEYGLFALNQYLGIGDLAYVVRANVNLNDSLVDVRAMWDTKMQESAYVLENLVNAYLNDYNTSNGYAESLGQTAVETLGAITSNGYGYVPGYYSNLLLTGGSGTGATANITVSNTAISTLSLLTVDGFNTGYGYNAATYTNVPLTGGSGTGATANITVSQTAIATLGTLVAGAGYTPGTYPGVALTGGTGTGATANITVTGTTRIGTLGIIATPGGGYADGTYANTALVAVTGTGTGALATIVVAGGSVTSVTLNTLNPLDRGTGYAVGDVLGVNNGTFAGGLGAGFTIPVATLSGEVTAVTIVNHGVGYTVADALSATLPGASGAGFTAPVATLAGAVTAATIVNHGVGYVVGNQLTATPGTIGGGVITGAAVTVAGTGYTDGTYPNTPLTNGTGTTGTGATATITVLGGIVTSAVIVSGGTGYVVGNTLSASNTILGIGGSGFVLTVNAVQGAGVVIPVKTVTGAITAVQVVSRGAGYSIGNSLSVTVPGGGVGFAVPVATLSGYKQTVSEAILLDLTATATQTVWSSFSFSNSEASFTDDTTASPKLVYGNGYTLPSTGSFVGFTGMTAAWVSGWTGSVVGNEWTALEAGNLLLGAADLFKYTTDFQAQTSLGANDAARRVAVVEALQAAINSNTDARSETYEYNLILCPGFPEVVDEMLNLCIDIQEEAMVLADTPFTEDPDSVAIWGATSARRSSRNIAYYYPHGLASNLDGKDVFIAASGTALRTITYSDDVSELWFAPAGTRRGLVSGVSMVGYVSGTLGTATTFNEVALNVGQRNNLYKYFTNINPIVFFPGRGIIVWGQKTSAPDASALDRINVVRLMAYIKRQLRKNTMSFVFEPNDQLTRDNLKATVDSFLGDLIVKRGLYDFATVCDESNNTPDRIDRNEMYVDIALKPVRAAEFIYIPIRVVATGAQI